MPHNSTGSESVTNHLKCGCMGLGLVIRGEEVWGCLKAVKVVLFGLCNTLSSLVLCSRSCSILCQTVSNDSHKVQKKILKSLPYPSRLGRIWSLPPLPFHHHLLVILVCFWFCELAKLIPASWLWHLFSALATMFCYLKPFMVSFFSWFRPWFKVSSLGCLPL